MTNDKKSHTANGSIADAITAAGKAEEARKQLFRTIVGDGVSGRKLEFTGKSVVLHLSDNSTLDVTPVWRSVARMTRPHKA